MVLRELIEYSYMHLLTTVFQEYKSPEVTLIVNCGRAMSGLETYFISHSQTFASGFNLNSQIAVSNSQLVFPTFEQFLSLRCGIMAIASGGRSLIHLSPFLWQRTG